MHVLKLVAVERNIVLLRPVRRYCGTILCPEISKGIYRHPGVHTKDASNTCFVEV